MTDTGSELSAGPILNCGFLSNARTCSLNTNAYSCEGKEKKKVGGER